MRSWLDTGLSTVPCFDRSRDAFVSPDNYEHRETGKVLPLLRPGQDVPAWPRFKGYPGFVLSKCADTAPLWLTRNGCQPRCVAVGLLHRAERGRRLGDFQRFTSLLQGRYKPPVPRSPYSLE